MVKHSIKKLMATTDDNLNRKRVTDKKSAKKGLLLRPWSKDEEYGEVSSVPMFFVPIYDRFCMEARVAPLS
jgi:hypothetical protein